MAATRCLQPDAIGLATCFPLVQRTSVAGWQHATAAASVSSAS